MKILNSILLSLLFCSSYAQVETLNIETFNWTIDIPENFVPIDPAEWNKTVKKGLDAVESTFDEKIDNQTETIFIYREGQFNNYEANWQPFDTEIDGDYLEVCSAVNEMLYITFETQMPDAKLDSISSVQKIDGLEFQRFDISIDLPNGIKMKTIGFNRLFDKKELTMNIFFLDDKIGKIMLDTFLKSKFN